jgi:hypothetical protein
MLFRPQPLHVREPRYLVWLDLTKYAPSRYMPTPLYDPIRLHWGCGRRWGRFDVLYPCDY